MRLVILGAGFGGLEVAARASSALGRDVEITLIDQADAFVFGYAKLDVLFGNRPIEAIRLPYADLRKPGVRFRQESIVSIDPATRRVETDLDSYEADVLVIALGADLDPDATPGLTEGGHEFYSLEGAERASHALATAPDGDFVVGVCGPSFKCPPAPSEAAILLDGYLRDRGMRDESTITLVMPFGAPVPPSPETSQALLQGFADREIRFVPEHRVADVDASNRSVTLDDGSSLPCDFFLGVPVHIAPPVVAAAGLTVDGWIPVEPGTLATSFRDVYAVGDVTSVGTAKAGVFAERAATVVAEQIVAKVRGGDAPARFDGSGTCYIEFGGEEVGKVEVDFFSGPSPVGVFQEPSAAIAAEKAEFGASRRARWFGTG